MQDHEVMGNLQRDSIAHLSASFTSSQQVITWGAGWPGKIEEPLLSELPRGVTSVYSSKHALAAELDGGGS